METTGKSLNPAINSEKSAAVANDEEDGWFYTYVGNRGMRKVKDYLSKLHIPTFIHYTVTYVEDVDGCRMKASHRATLGNILFIRGVADNITAIFSESFPGLHLSVDCATGRPAFIPHSQMRYFMLAAEEDRPIRFTYHGEEYYSLGNSRIRVVGGVLRGMEGYLIRIGGDRSLVTTIGDKIVIIGKSHNDPVERIDEYETIARRLLNSFRTVTDIEAGIEESICNSFTVAADSVGLLTMVTSLKENIGAIRLLFGHGRSRSACHAAEVLVRGCAEGLHSTLPKITLQTLSRLYEKSMKRIVEDTVTEVSTAYSLSGEFQMILSLDRISGICSLSSPLRNIKVKVKAPPVG